MQKTIFRGRDSWIGSVPAVRNTNRKCYVSILSHCKCSVLIP